MLLTIFFIIICSAVGLKLYLINNSGVCKSRKRLDGKTVLLTGGNSGIGFETAKDIASRGARLIITSENYEDCIRAKNDIIKLTKNENVIAKYLDLSSLEVTRSFAEDFVKSEERLDVLINNADLLKKSKPSRIVNICSMAVHTSYVTDYDSINSFIDKFSEGNIYSNSKYFMLCMTWELAARLKNLDVTINCVHPGLVNTRIYKKCNYINDYFGYIIWISLRLYMKTANQGAQTSIHCAVSEEVENITDCKPFKPYVKKDLVIMKKVWDQSIQLVKLQPNEIKI